MPNQVGTSTQTLTYDLPEPRQAKPSSHPPYSPPSLAQVCTHMYAKEAYIHRKRGLYTQQKRHTYTEKEAYIHSKRGLYTQQKRPTYTAKEAYIHSKRGLHTQQKRSAHICVCISLCFHPYARVQVSFCIHVRVYRSLSLSVCGCVGLFLHKFRSLHRSKQRSLSNGLSLTVLYPSYPRASPRSVYTHMSHKVWPKRPVQTAEHMQKETYTYAKRDLHIRTRMQTETYTHRCLVSFPILA